MKIINETPPCYEEAKKLFELSEKSIIFFSYGDCVYAPDGKAPTADIIAHEEVHLEQQGHSRLAAKIWWDRYLIDPVWRVEQEAEAYAEQYNFYCRQEKDKNKRFQYLHQVAIQLASPLYGSVIKYSEALKKVRSYAQGEAVKDIEAELN